MAISPKDKIAIIGSGNVAFHLYKAFSDKGLNVSLINSRTIENLDDSFNSIIVSVSDKAISEVSDAIALRLPRYEGIVAHTAGSVPLDILLPLFHNCGVFYPLQTFNKNIPIPDFSIIPVFVEGNNEKALSLLQSLASSVSRNVYALDSEKREKLHLASVFACNFTNAMYGVADEILKDTGIPFSALLPLIERTAAKVHETSPSDCQTGPAIRGDYSVMQHHLEMLASHPDLQRLYSLVSSLISSK